MTSNTTFKDILTSLPSVEHIQTLTLLDDAGQTIAILANQPGTAGSVRVYYALLQRHGQIHPAAAVEGLQLYAEHTADARQHPGKHPNIDRLIAIAEQQAPSLQGQLALVE